MKKCSKNITYYLDFKKFLPIIILFTLLSLTAAMWFYMSKIEIERAQEHFVNESRDLLIKINERVNGYHTLLNGAAAVFAASEHVSREEWGLYYNFQQIPAQFPGLINLCYSKIAIDSEYDINPKALVKYIEPSNGNRDKLYGYDLLSNHIRRYALDLSRDIGKTVASSAITDTLSEASKIFMLATPLYRYGDIPESLDERRVLLDGYITADVDIKTLVNSISFNSKHQFSTTIYDSTYVSDSNLIFHIPYVDKDLRFRQKDNYKSQFKSQTVIEIFNHNWTIVNESTKYFDSSVNRFSNTLVLILGLAVSLLSFYLMVTLRNIAAKAEVLASGLTISLKESESKLRQITDNISDVIFTTDLNLKTTYVSPSIERLTGFSSEEYLKMSMTDRHPPYSIENFKKILEEEFEREMDQLNKIDRSRIIEVDHYKSDGSIINTSIHLSFIRDPDGIITGIQGVTRDVTNESRMMNELKLEKVRAERGDRLKTAFINNISHEIRTPLNGIIGFGQLLSEEDVNEEDKEHYITQLKISSGRLLQSITDYMDIAMISSENLQIRGEVFNVKLFLEELYNEMRRQYRDISKVIFTLSIPDNLLNIKIKTDRELIKKVFNHLIGNAFKFTKKGTIEFGTNIINTRARFYVKDSGIGIATDKIDEIFNPYVQEETDITRGYEGSGLGLAISKGIIERLGGNLWVESKKGIGSIFYFELPLTTE